ncbi:MAG: ACP S-malonyltransferase [Clostridiales bacterium]|nr:ACP S-malonyltransferase [Clostridiales bacterium]
MGKIAFVFAGQGAQHTGMGKEISENVSAAAEIFAKADSVRPGTSQQCFEGSSELLAETKNTQPCIYTVDMAMAAALEANGVKADMAAGYSLGELAALAYAGSFSFDDGLGLVSQRGAIMQKASESCDSGMMAVLKLSDEKIEELSSKYTKVYPVNFNCNGQVTVAGDRAQLDQFKDDVKEAKGLVRILEVSGGFHSPFMSDAAEEFKKVLEGADIKDANIPVYSNWTAKPYEGDYKKALEMQIANPIRWKNIIEDMIENGADTFIELGPGTALTKMITRISKKVRMFNVKDMESLELTLKGVKENA